MMKTASITKMDSDLSLKDIQPYQITIRGVVKAADGSTLPGVAVNVKGTNRGVNSDINGVFSLDKIKTGDMLSFSFVGFDTKEITVKDSTTQQIILQEDNQVLSEVVVTGYGGKAKRAAKKAARKTKREQKNRR
jgi:phage head maturation protease